MAVSAGRAAPSLAYVVGKGLPMGGQMLINSSASLIMVGLVNREGMVTVAAFGAILQLWAYIQMPSFAVSTAVSAMVAQNIGAGHHDRVNRINVAGLAVNGIVTTSAIPDAGGVRFADPAAVPGRGQSRNSRLPSIFRSWRAGVGCSRGKW